MTFAAPRCVECAGAAMAPPPSRALTTRLTISRLRGACDQARFFSILAKPAAERTCRELDIIARECQSVPFFRQFAPSQRRVIFAVLTVRTVSRGETLMLQGSRADGPLGVLLHGALAVYKRAENPPKRSRNALGVFVCALEPGDAFGERSLLDARSASLPPGEDEAAAPPPYRPTRARPPRRPAGRHRQAAGQRRSSRPPRACCYG